jgi:hypothetical protein
VIGAGSRRRCTCLGSQNADVDVVGIVPRDEALQPAIITIITIITIFTITITHHALRHVTIQPREREREAHEEEGREGGTYLVADGAQEGAVVEEVGHAMLHE